MRLRMPLRWQSASVARAVLAMRAGRAPSLYARMPRIRSDHSPDHAADARGNVQTWRVRASDGCDRLRSGASRMRRRREAVPVTRSQLVIASYSLDELVELARRLNAIAASLDELVELARRLNAIAAPAQLAGAAMQPTIPVGAGFCSAGHGAMRMIPAGTAKSGPRIGQPYPAFLKCGVCGERQEVAP